MTRNFKIDNLKGLLIFLVVWGHLLECFTGDLRLWIYLIIYSFHMPAFAYTTGYFSRFDPKRIVNKIWYPYCIYQILYLIFQRFYLQEKNTFQFTTPYWLLWYFVSSTFWMFILLILEKSQTRRIKLILMTISVALLVGFDNSIGYYLSLSRTLVLFPFYLAGYYHYLDDFSKQNIHKFGRIFCSIGIFLSIIAIWCFRGYIQASWFYHALPYKENDNCIYIRLLIFFVSILWLLFLSSAIPGYKIKIISKMGQNTISIFLIHGFAVKFLNKINFFHWTEVKNIFVSLILACAFCIILGNDKIVQIFEITFNANNIKKYKN